MSEAPHVDSPAALIEMLDTHFGLNGFEDTENKDVDINLPENIIVHITRDKYTKARVVLPEDDDIDLLIAALIDKPVMKQKALLLVAFIKKSEAAQVVIIDEEAEFGTITDGTKLDVSDDPTFVPVGNYPEELTVLPNEFGLLMYEDKHIRLTTVEQPLVKAADDRDGQEKSSAEEKETGSNQGQAEPQGAQSQAGG